MDDGDIKAAFEKKAKLEILPLDEFFAAAIATPCGPTRFSVEANALKGHATMPIHP